MTKDYTSQRASGYYSYLLRLWLVHQSGTPTWHAVLEDPRTGERLSFADLQRLCEFLNERANDLVSPDDKG